MNRRICTMAGNNSDGSLIMQVDDSTKMLMETIQRGITRNIQESIDEMRRMVTSLSDNVSTQTDSIESIEDTIKDTKRQTDKLGKRIVDDLTPKLASIQEQQDNGTQALSLQQTQIGELQQQIGEIKAMQGAQQGSIKSIISGLQRHNQTIFDRINELRTKTDAIQETQIRISDQQAVQQSQVGELQQQVSELKELLNQILGIVKQQGEETKGFLACLSEQEAQDRADIDAIQRKMKQNRSSWR